MIANNGKFANLALENDMKTNKIQYEIQSTMSTWRGLNLIEKKSPRIAESYYFIG